MNSIQTPQSAIISAWCGTGLPLDFSLAGYLTAIPGFLLIASAWTKSSILRRIRQGYFGIIAFVMSCIFIIDLGLYGFWGFRLDATPIFYFFSSPKDAMASVSFWFILLGILAMLIYAAILYGIFYAVLIREKAPLKIPYQRQYVSLVLLLLTAALFIPIRGGFSVSTMNLSKVYYSQNQRMIMQPSIRHSVLCILLPIKTISISNIGLWTRKLQMSCWPKCWINLWQ